MKKNIIPAAALQEKITAMTPVHKAVLFLGTFLLLGGLFYFFQYQDQETRIVQLTSSVAQQEKKLAELKRASVEVVALEKELANSEQEFSRLLALLPDQREIPGLLENISELGAEVGLENILFQPQPEQPKEFYATIPVRLDLIGSFQKLETFFDKISKLNRILKVENLSMTRQHDNSLIQVSCTIETYRFIEKPATPPGKAPPKK